MDFVILAPGYRHNSAGIRVIHKLCHLLNKCNYRASIITSRGHEVNPNWIAPHSRGIGKQTVAIYPEVVSGNPLRAKHVARYVLNDPGVIGGETKYDSKEYIFSYHDIYLEGASKAAGKKITDVFTIPDFERELFFNAQARRDTDCFYVGKGEAVRKRWKVNETGLIHITGLWPATREELAKLLQRTKILYSYDDKTALCEEAIACGCQSLVIKNGLICEYKSTYSAPSEEGERGLVHKLVSNIKAHFNL